MAKAQSDAIDETKERLAELDGQRAKLAAALKRIGDAA
jgi:hypothetical protein